MMSLDSLDPVKDEEWPGASMLKEAEEKDIYYHQSHGFSHIDFSANMNQSGLGNLTSLEC